MLATWLTRSVPALVSRARVNAAVPCRRRFLATRASAVQDGQLLSAGVLSRRLNALAARVEAMHSVVDVPLKSAQLADLEQRCLASDLWSAPLEAQRVLQAVSDLKLQITDVKRIASILSDAETALELLDVQTPADEGSTDLLHEANAFLHDLEAALDAWELQRLLDMPYASSGAVLTITAGAGGTDAQDWAEMLLRMYERWACAQGFTCKLLELSEGDEAGIKSAMLEVAGRYAYGFLLAEKGTHRLVRLSPFNAKAARQTSFAGVEVMPMLAESAAAAAVLPEEDVEIIFTRSGGKGGQNVNKVETAVRVRHLPTGLFVKCTQERSQARNKEKALEILKAKLLVIAEEQRATDIAGIRGDIVKAEWGQQIRNYVLHPYKLVKDVRTDVETADTEGVLGGELKPFIVAWLRQRAAAASTARADEQLRTKGS